jgi:hypothetical protein
MVMPTTKGNSNITNRLRFGLATHADRILRKCDVSAVIISKYASNGIAIKSTEGPREIDPPRINPMQMHVK